MWSDRRLIELFDIEIPIVQAPMAGAVDWELVAAAAEAGALGSLPCAMPSWRKLPAVPLAPILTSPDSCLGCAAPWRP